MGCVFRELLGNGNRAGDNLAPLISSAPLGQLSHGPVAVPLLGPCVALSVRGYLAEAVGLCLLGSRHTC